MSWWKLLRRKRSRKVNHSRRMRFCIAILCSWQRCFDCVNFCRRWILYVLRKKHDTERRLALRQHVLFSEVFFWNDIERFSLVQLVELITECAVCLCMFSDVNPGGTNHNRYIHTLHGELTCNFAFTDFILGNSDHKQKPGPSDLLCWSQFISPKWAWIGTFKPTVLQRTWAGYSGCDRHGLGG